MGRWRLALALCALRLAITVAPPMAAATKLAPVALEAAEAAGVAGAAVLAGLPRCNCRAAPETYHDDS